MANTDVYVNKITLPKDASNTYTAYLVDNVSGYTKTPVMTWYGTSSTTASTAEKTVTCSGYALNAGNIIGVNFSTANTAATPTLNVNSTGAKTIYLGTSTLNSTTNVLKWSANTIVYFMYDGTYYRYLYATSAASVTQPRGANTWYGTSSTTASTQAKTSTIDNYVLTKGSLVVINFSTANTYTSAKITLNINSTGAKDVYYNNAVTSSTNTLLWDANTTIVFVYDGTGYAYLGSSRDTQNLGTVTSVTASGILSSSGGTTPAITHNAPSTSPATSGDAAVYPIKIDSYGHITEKGSAVTIPSVTSTYSSTGTTAVNGTAVNAALQTLDSSITATTGQAISAITITDGKIASSSKINVGDANQNAFSTIAITQGTTTTNIAADTTTDTFTIVAGSNITLTPDSTNDKVTIAASQPTVPSAGTTASAVGTTSSGGSASTYSKSDHVHNITSSTITSALGFTPISSDTKVTNTLGTTTKYYVTGTTSASTNTGTQTFDSGIYATTTAGQLNATTYKVNEAVTLEYNSSTQSLDFIF